MAGRYSPIYSTVWDDPDLEGLSFEAHAFFVFLWSNHRMQPSGIYRVTDDQLAADSGLGLSRVQGYLRALVSRHRIVRDGAWLFVRGYLARQPNSVNFRRAVERELCECTSRPILEAFCQRYPLFDQRLADRLATVPEPLHGIAATDRDSDTDRDTDSDSDTPPYSPPTGRGDFDRFWAAYPKRVGKGAARTAWNRLRCETRTDAILASLTRQATYLGRENGQYVPNPATWLSQRRWEDDPPVPLSPGTQKTLRNISGAFEWLESRGHQPRGDTP